MPLPESQSDSLFARIHFDTLFRQSKDDVTDYSGNIWTDRGEHDPGVTLLQALTWTTSDMAYRHSFPLPHLLTPQKAGNATQNIFPQAFDASHVLTSAPVTLDDLRRGILDLPEKGPEVGYHFRNARILPLSKDEQYTYYFDGVDGQFKFINPALNGHAPQSGGDDAAKAALNRGVQLQVSGDYVVEVELNRGVEPGTAKKDLDEYLAKNRHPTENYTTVTTLRPDIVKMLLSLELDDDWIDYALTLSMLLKTVDEYIRPQAERVAGPGAGHAKEDLYQGPRPAFGWITRLPDASPKSIDIRPLTRLILNDVPGVKSILGMTTGSDLVKPDWERKIKAGSYALPWGQNSAEVETNVSGSIALYKKGRLINTASYVTKGIELFMTPALRVVTMQETGIPGQYRDPHMSYPTYKLLPAVYRQHNNTVGHGEGALSALLLPYELWNFYLQKRLMMLPESLSFERGDKVSQAYDTLIKDDDNHARARFSEAFDYDAEKVKAALPAYSELFHDSEHELEIIQHLQSYFGETRAARTLLNKAVLGSDNEYMMVQQGFLSRLSDINYRRSVIDIKSVFSLQLRIAARLGVGAAFFASQTKIGNLPFYIIENRKLLPQRPHGKALENMQGAHPITVTALSVQAEKMTIQCPKKDIDGLVSGIMIDLTLKGGSGTDKDITYENLLVRELKAETGEIILYFADDARLTNNRAIIEAHKSRTLVVSPVMLRNKRYTLTKGMLASPGADAIVMDNIPAWIMAGTTLKVYPWGNISDRRNNTTDQENRKVALTTLEVKGIDLSNRKVLLTKPVEESVFKDKTKNTVSEVYFEVVPTNDNEAFSSTLTFVFPFEWIQSATSEMTGWIEDCVREEIPAHLNHQITYMDHDTLTTFGSTYLQWTQEGFRLGGTAYKILSMLSLAERPADGNRGVGVMRVATKDEASAAQAEKKALNDVDYTNILLNKDIFFVGVKPK